MSAFHPWRTDWLPGSGVGDRSTLKLRFTTAVPVNGGQYGYQNRGRRLFQVMYLNASFARSALAEDFHAKEASI